MVIHKLNKNQKAFLKNSFGNRQNQLNIDKERLKQVTCTITVSHNITMNSVTNTDKNINELTKPVAIELPSINIPKTNSNISMLSPNDVKREEEKRRTFISDPDVFAFKPTSLINNISNNKDLYPLKTTTKPIHMDMFLSDTMTDFDIKKLKQKNVHTICHTYCVSYGDLPDVTYPTGLGDFIRSCFFVLQFCNTYDFKCNFIINHPISVYLKNTSSTNNFTSLSKFTHFFTDTNWVDNSYDSRDIIIKANLNKNIFQKYIEHLCSLPVFYGNVFSYNILFPYSSITQTEISRVRDLFEPSTQFVEDVTHFLSTFGIDKLIGFKIIHIRSGDKHLIDGLTDFNTKYFQVLFNHIKYLLKSNSASINWILMADSNEVKNVITSMLKSDPYTSNIKVCCSYEKITHIGEGVCVSDTDALKQTMMEFFIMSMAREIYSFSSYAHGSGFSYWCSVLYNIPYQCKYIRL